MTLAIDALITAVDRVAYDPANAPYYGWHDDHKHHDGTEDYRPALQQVRAEFMALVVRIAEMPRRGAALQLGLGNGIASHNVWRSLFDHAVTIDRCCCLVDELEFPGAATLSPEAILFAKQHNPYDLLFIDAGHSYCDVVSDWAIYKSWVRKGGLIVFHDALPREAYPEVEIHKFLADANLPNLTIVGDEVGTAWYTKP